LHVVKDHGTDRPNKNRVEQVQTLIWILVNVVLQVYWFVARLRYNTQPKGAQGGFVIITPSIHPALCITIIDVERPTDTFIETKTNVQIHAMIPYKICISRGRKRWKKTQNT
jgi:hypothetical protein